MQLQLQRDLVFFDVETTGLNVLRDRIVQIALIKYPKDSSEPKELSMLINPGIPISEESMSIHGLTPKILANKPTFGQVADQLLAFIGNADLAGYNSNRFDIPMLLEEFARVGIDFDLSRRRTIDVQRIFYKMEPRTLKAALRFYCHKELEDAHDALADVRATVDVFKGQIEHYADKDLTDEDGKTIDAPIKNDMQVLHEFTNDLRMVDATQKLRYDQDGSIVFNFGKYNGQRVIDVITKDKNYYIWLIEKDFSVQVKNTVKGLMQAHEKAKRG